MLPIFSNQYPKAVLVLADGSVFQGYGVGAPGHVVAEVVFALGGRRALHDAITARAGPLRSGSTVASQPSADTKTL